MSYNTNIPIVNDGLVFAIDGLNTKSSKSETRTQTVTDLIEGNSEYLSSNNSSFTFGDSDFAIGCWVKIPAFNTASVIGKDQPTSGLRSYQIRLSGNAFNFGGSSDGTTLVECGFTPVLAYDTWHFLVGVHDSTDNVFRFSYNGNDFATSGTITGGVFNTSVDFQIGKRGNDATTYFSGQIKNAFSYNKALSQQEVNTLYSWGNGITYNDLTKSQKTDLLSWWNLDETSGERKDSHIYGLHLTDNNTVGSTSETFSTNIIKDLSSNQVGGSPINGVTLDSNNQIWDFDGVNDYIDFGDIFNYQVFTVELWVKFKSTISSSGAIIGNNNSSSQGFYIGGNADNTLRFMGGQNNNNSFLNSVVTNLSNYMNPNKWHHIMCSFSNITGEYKIYIDSVLRNTYVDIGSITYSNNFSLVLGCNGNKNFFGNQQTSNVKIYNRALTSQEVLQNYNATKYRFK